MPALLALTRTTPEQDRNGRRSAEFHKRNSDFVTLDVERADGPPFGCERRTSGRQTMCRRVVKGARTSSITASHLGRAKQKRRSSSSTAFAFCRHLTKKEKKCKVDMLKPLLSQFDGEFASIGSTDMRQRTAARASLQRHAS